MFKNILSRLSAFFLFKKPSSALEFGRFQLENLQSQMLRFEFYYIDEPKPTDDRFIPAQELSFSELKSKFAEAAPTELPIVLAGRGRHKADRCLEKMGFKQVYLYSE